MQKTVYLKPTSSAFPKSGDLVEIRGNPRSNTAKLIGSGGTTSDIVQTTMGVGNLSQSYAPADGDTGTIISVTPATSMRGQPAGTAVIYELATTAWFVIRVKDPDDLPQPGDEACLDSDGGSDNLAYCKLFTPERDVRLASDSRVGIGHLKDLNRHAVASVKFVGPDDNGVDLFLVTVNL
jgi:hypothetical protein